MLIHESTPEDESYISDRNLMVIRSLFSACQSRNKISSSPGALSSLHVEVVILQTKQISECRTAGFLEQASGF